MIEFHFRNNFRGPSPYGSSPLVVAQLDFAPDALLHGPQRCEAIARACEDWFEPDDGRLKSPDQAVTVAAFLAEFSLALLNRAGGFLHEAGALRDEHGNILVCVEFHRAEVTMAAIAFTAELFKQIDPTVAATIADNVQAFCKRCEPLHPDYQIRFLMAAARDAALPFLPFVAQQRLWQFGWGRNSVVHFESEPRGDSAIGWKLARDKQAAKQLLRGLGVPVPQHVMVSSESDLANAAKMIGWPCVVKPSSGGRSMGVTTDVRNLAQLTAAYRLAQQQDRGPVMVERHVPGDVYRIIVARGAVTSIVRREAPHVFGDGRQSLRALIDAQNRLTAARIKHEPYLGPIPFDGELDAELKRQRIALGDIVPAGTKVMLRKVPLLSTGAIYCDVTDQAHPDVRRMAEVVTAAFGLEICGIDYIGTDITRSCSEGGAILELNTTPGLRVPMVAGMSAVEVGRMILGERPGRIPVALVIAPAPDLARLRAAITPEPDLGWVIAGECGIAALPLNATAGSGEPLRVLPMHDLVQQILRNPLLGSLLIGTTPEAITEAGLPLDHCDTIIGCGFAPDDKWRAVLQAHGGHFIEVASVDEAMAQLRA